MLVPNPIKFRIVCPVGGGDFGLRVEPEEGKVFLGDIELRTIEFVFDVRKLTYPAVWTRLDDCDVAKPPMAIVHISVPDAETIANLAAYKGCEFLELQVMGTNYARRQGRWKLNDFAALALELHYDAGEPTFRVVNAYKSVEEVFGAATAEALTA